MTSVDETESDRTPVCSVTITPTEEKSKTVDNVGGAAGTQKSFGSDQSFSNLLPPPVASLAASFSEPILPGACITPRMDSLAAPAPVQSSVFTANKPKNSLTAASLSTASATGNPRNKVALRKGRGLMDWVRLGHTQPDLAGTGGRLLQVTPRQLAKHNTRTDAWLALRGKVYNVTPYFEYHPGGEDELSRGIGRDATELFNEVHKWVNFESMLAKCLVGHLVEDSPTSCSKVLRKPQEAFLPLLNSFARLLTEGRGKSPSRSTKDDTVPKLPPLSPTQSCGTVEARQPSYDWYQSNTAVTVTVYSRWPRITHRHCTVHLKNKTLSVDLLVQRRCYRLRLDLSRPVKQGQFTVRVGGGGCGTVTIEVMKVEEGIRWTNIGLALPGNEDFVDVETMAVRLKSVANVKLELNKIKQKLDFWSTNVCEKTPAISKPYTAVPEELSVAAWTSDVATPGNCLHYLVKVYHLPLYSVEELFQHHSRLWFTSGRPRPLPGSHHLVSLAEGVPVERLSRGEGEGVREIQDSGDAPVGDVALLAAGTGITPMISVMLDSLALRRRVRLLFFNKTEEDIPWRDELDNLRAENSELLQVHHVLSCGGPGWGGLRGRVSLRLLEPLLPVGDGGRCVVLAVCGPKGFTDASTQIFGQLGYLKEDYHAFVG
ncbi:cytochrome b5 reductase 4 [Hyalella azteca]|uniref:Cytochrome b5 reductase 4 n=1 Tax=Hyalella azteca TaxID=294128 RepID=A0A979FY58_HYAAZ|nr:cytochrome b5 reductase 4 [Hyalella azteca]